MRFTSRSSSRRRSFGSVLPYWRTGSAASKPAATFPCNSEEPVSQSRDFSTSAVNRGQLSSDGNPNPLIHRWVVASRSCTPNFISMMVAKAFPLPSLNDAVRKGPTLLNSGCFAISASRRRLLKMGRESVRFMDSRLHESLSPAAKRLLACQMPLWRTGLPDCCPSLSQRAFATYSKRSKI